MIINNGIAEALEYEDIVNGELIFPDSVSEVHAEIGMVEEMLELVRNFAANKAESIVFLREGREIYSLSTYFPNLETFSANLERYAAIYRFVTKGQHFRAARLCYRLVIT